MDRSRESLGGRTIPWRWYGALVFAAILWGIAFVPQRSAMQDTGPLTFNALRFGLGAALVAICCGLGRFRRVEAADIKPIMVLGVLLFLGAALQQIGMVSTTAGQGGFITGFYIVLVPIFLCLVWGDRITWNCWSGALIALVGLGFLSLTEHITVSVGDAWILACAVAFSLHVISIGKLGLSRDPIVLTVGQNLVCAALNGAGALLLEQDRWTTIDRVMPELAYMVFCSIGLAYTLQVLAQRHVPVADAALILSLEGVFAALGGWYLLGEKLAPIQLGGCVLMLGGIVLAQLHLLKSPTAQAP
ncbi:MAG: DMT family transporter [Proteobacteria bacterium]|nr:DMT family transporter [Pseudomonadota bacterium]